jgi:uncharacterized membrane protein YfcA
MGLAALSDWWYPAAVALLGYTVLGVTGFGSALVAVPLLSWVWPLPQVVAVVVSLDIVASVLHGGLNAALVQWRTLLRLLPGVVLGVALGALAAPWLGTRWPLLALGLYVTWIGLKALRQRPAPTVTTSPPTPVAATQRMGGSDWAVGIVVGAIELLFGTAGPPVVAWLSRRLGDVQQVRATAPVAMSFASVIALAGMATDGRLGTALHWQRFGVLLGVAIVAVVLGHRMAQRLPAERLRRIVCVLLVASGLALVARAFAG